MCVKLLSRDLNSSSCPPHLTSIYIYGMTITLRLRSCYYVHILRCLLGVFVQSCAVSYLTSIRKLSEYIIREW